MKTSKLDRLDIVYSGLILLIGAMAFFPFTRRLPTNKIVELHFLRAKPFSEESSLKKVGRENFGSYGLCSGFFISPTGDILTARHCAVDTTEIEVITSDHQTYQASVVRLSKRHDLALLHIDRTHTPYFSLARQVNRGDAIFVLGSPLGITDILSQGYIARLAGDYTFLDCGALPGNSGSAVFNKDGYLVGVVTAGLIVGLGTTHLNVAESLEAITYFLRGTNE